MGRREIERERGNKINGSGLFRQIPSSIYRLEIQQKSGYIRECKVRVPTVRKSEFMQIHGGIGSD